MHFGPSLVEPLKNKNALRLDQFLQTLYACFGRHLPRQPGIQASEAPARKYDPVSPGLGIPTPLGLNQSYSGRFL